MESTDYHLYLRTNGLSTKEILWFFVRLEPRPFLKTMNNFCNNDSSSNNNNKRTSLADLCIQFSPAKQIYIQVALLSPITGIEFGK